MRLDVIKIYFREIMTSDPFSLKGKRVVVSGAAGAIGGAICTVLSERGAEVVGFDIVEQISSPVLSSYRYTKLDGLDEQALAEFASTMLPDNFPDAIICAQGISGEVTDAEKVDMVQFRECIMASVDASAAIVKCFTPRLKSAGCGSIVLFSSTAGMRGNALMPAYTAAKHAVIGLVRSYARELGPWGVRVNALLPGLIQSPMATSILNRLEERRNPTQSALTELPQHSSENIPLRRLGTPEDIVNAAHFLVSDASSFCNGTLLNVDGGALVRS